MAIVPTVQTLRLPGPGIRFGCSLRKFLKTKESAARIDSWPCESSSARSETAHERLEMPPIGHLRQNSSRRREAETIPGAGGKKAFPQATHAALCTSKSGRL